MLKTDGIYFAYLRKSREDRDAELNGAEDTLARHEYIINDMVKRNNIHISKWYREVVSGETIADRPEMMSLLKDIETIHPDGVLVVEVERLSRGNPQDQGRVMDTFKYSNTLIITPMKIYDLTKENDEEWMDFGLMRSRMEYRTIKRRLQNGRITSAMQGKYIGNMPPYGWVREKLKGEKGYTLTPDPETSWVLALIYQLLSIGNQDTEYRPVGINIAARILDRMGIAPPKGESWSPCSLSRIAQNPTNIGMVRIGYRKEVSSVTDGIKHKSRPINTDCLLVPARWKGIVDTDTFNLVCEKLKKNSRSGTFRDITNPLAGIVCCSICKRTMVRRPRSRYQKNDVLLCPTYKCPTVGAYWDLIEQRLLSSLEDYLSNYKLDINPESGIDWESSIALKEKSRQETLSTINRLENQLTKVYNLFEQDIYDLTTYLSRSQMIKDEINTTKAVLATIDTEISGLKSSSETKEIFIPYFESILESYKNSSDPKYKNVLLKEILTQVDYTKTVKGRKSGQGNDAFELDIHINLMARP